jgi:hypothetical protein
MTKRLGTRAKDFDQALLESVSYCEATGEFTWRLPPRRGVSSGGAAGVKQSRGYVSIGFRSRLIYAHRLAWLVMYGKWPDGVIDHINGDKSDNRIENLRDVSQRLNTQNVFSPRKHNKCGVLGVRCSGDRYIAQIANLGRVIHIGTFDSKEQAHQAYLMKKRELHQGSTL